MIASRFDAYSLPRTLGAAERLIRHVELGVAFHDAGKILFPAELHGPGSLHEAAGEQLLIEHDVQANVARCCVTHAAWSEEGVTLEERTVALADKLWKGKREVKLELLVIDGVANRLGVARWDVFAERDSTFEDITAGVNDRLSRSEV